MGTRPTDISHIHLTNLEQLSCYIENLLDVKKYSSVALLLDSCTKCRRCLLSPTPRMITS